MAFIGTLRNRMGTWVVVFVFVAIALFIIGDLFTGKTSFLKINSNSVGEIAGHDVSLEEFQGVVDERKANYYLNFNREASDREMPTLRQQAWELLILRYAIEPQYEKLGVKVTSDEVWDMVQGKNIDPNVQQSFTNPQTGQFDRNQVVEFLKRLNTPPATTDQTTLTMWQQQKVRWETFQRDLLPGRERIKYENLIIKTNYITTAEAERAYHAQTDVAEIKYLYIPFYADSTSAVSEAALNDYYNKHREQFKTKDARSILYVTFPVTPTSGDSLEIRREAERIATEFATTQEDSLFAYQNSDGQNAYGKYTAGNLPSFVSQADLVAGKVIGPFVDNGAFKVVKISKISRDTTYTARASHILIRPADPSDASKKEAKEKARGILKDIKAGASFAAKAREFGTDGTAQRGGDLGWFSSGQMVKPFQNAVFAASKKGLLNDVVETDFGYHIIDVTEVKDNVSYSVAVVERTIAPSDATTNEVYRNAETFAADLDGVSNFKERAQTNGLTPAEGNDIESDARFIGNLGESRDIVRWLFNEASEGKVSTVFDKQDNYVVAIMTGGVEAGYKPLSSVKEEIRPLALDQVRGGNIISKLGQATGTLEDIAHTFGDQASVFTSADLKLANNSLTSAGVDPAAIGIAFSLESGKRSKPFIGERGVLIIEMQNKTIAPAIADYTTYKTQIEQNTQGRSASYIAEAIKDNSSIEDKRYKFY